MTKALAINSLTATLAVAFFFCAMCFVPVRAAECGLASWYSTENGQTRTATGERYTGNDLTAAHRSLPFGTRLRVTYKGKSVVVRLNDRGPYVKGRSLDLSRAAAAKIGLIRPGVARVCWERVR